MSDQNKTPVDRLQDGNLKAAIWENERDGRTYHGVQFRRSYRDAEGQYRDTDSFAGQDLLRLSRLAEKAYDRVQDLREQDKAQAHREPRQTRSRARDQDRGR